MDFDSYLKHTHTLKKTSTQYISVTQHQQTNLLISMMQYDQKLQKLNGPLGETGQQLFPRSEQEAQL